MTPTASLNSSPTASINSAPQSALPKRSLPAGSSLSPRAASIPARSAPASRPLASNADIPPRKRTGRRLRFPGILLALPVFLSGHAVAQSVAPGFSTAALFNPSGAARALSNGDLIVWDGQRVERRSPSGALLATLVDFSPLWFFTGALAIAPDESVALVGESSNGDLFRVDLTSGGATPIANLNFNFDAVFESPSSALVSATSGLIGSGSEVSRVQIQSGAVTPLVAVPGASGPLAIDGQGNLLLGTSSSSFPAPLGSSDVYLFLSSQLTGMPPLTVAQGLKLGSGFDGASALAYDPALGQIFLAENNFGSGANRIRLVAGTASQSPTLFEGPTGGWLGIQGFVPSTGGAQFGAFQPAFGGRLILTSTDFFSYDERLALEPARPLLAASGPGASGPGPFSLDFCGGPAFGLCLLAYGPSSGVGPELPFVGLGQPLLIGLDLGSAQLFPTAFGLDSVGAFGQAFQNGGALSGALSVQALCFGSGGTALGSSQVLGL
jgi:hypothetical protein